MPPQDDLLTALQIYLLLALAIGAVAFWLLGKIIARWEKRTASVQLQSAKLQSHNAPVQSPAPRNAIATPLQAVTAIAEWWRTAIAEAIHLLLVGDTGSGKSFTACALMFERSKIGKIIIIDPHAEPDDWFGVPAIGAGRKYAVINIALERLIAEMQSRYDERALGRKQFESLTIFIDEWPAIAANCIAAADFMKCLAREGRKVAMRLCILTQSDRVKSLGIEGEGDTRENFSFIFLGAKAIQLNPKAFGPQERAAAFRWHEKDYKADVSFLSRYAGAKVDPAAVWHIDVSLPAALPVADAGLKLSDQHVKVAAIIAREPAIGGRELARRLYPDSDGSGGYYERAKKLREEVEQVLSVKPVIV